MTNDETRWARDTTYRYLVRYVPRENKSTFVCSKEVKAIEIPGIEFGANFQLYDILPMMTFTSAERYFIKWAIPGLFSIYLNFQQLSVIMFIIPMFAKLGLELWTSRIRSNSSANWATINVKAEKYF